MRGVKKSDLPSKTCIVCGLPFTWRKKWENNWENVKYCSKRCANSKKQQKDTAP
ncbi:DUF2256 domain-containing protein [Flavobacterium album]|uniref:DUF2256 domain-containing protein n=1 Tax=Flavobacterium album TaxID=2175091 RepID=A0A2S1R1I4_9FLAO|nr:DUF2256 domain-containing protein [Flavobacterium album]AWH86504.1 DUF2256 domain-containing protein [Flavobacterium album]